MPPWTRSGRPGQAEAGGNLARRCAPPVAQPSAAFASDPAGRRSGSWHGRCIVLDGGIGGHARQRSHRVSLMTHSRRAPACRFFLMSDSPRAPARRLRTSCAVPRNRLFHAHPSRAWIDVRFIHTADWHIGRHFRFVHDAHRQSVLKQARIDAIQRIAALARQHGAGHVLVAGDVYDAVDVGDLVLRQPLERMRDAAPLRWHLIPGNHDPDRPGGPYDRLARLADLPPNVLVHRSAEPIHLDQGVVLLPAPLQERAQDHDPTGWMDHALTPEGAMRVGLAHGPVTDFGRLEHAERQPAHNLIAPDRPERAGLDYLALGDWHAPLRIGPRIWYAGTPEADGFGRVERGQALVVEIEGRGAPPSVLPLPVGRYCWRTEQAVIEDAASVDALLERLRALPVDDGLGHLCLCLRVQGALSLPDRARFEDRLVAWLESALAYLRLETDGLHDAPAADDLDAIATSGAIRLAAERLDARSRDPDDPDCDTARAALRLLYGEQRRARPS
ncbi:MAG TPA: metallophosphoesterase [Geminicoccaceae bacterium]